MPRIPLIAANWKMNPIPTGALASDSPYRPRGSVETIVFPTFLDLKTCSEAGLVTGAQCGRPETAGAFTGDVSMAQIAETGCRYVLCGHSDRRRFHGESDAFIAEQALSALRVGLIPIVCIGETEEEREKGKGREVVTRQLTTIPKEVMVIAYEPVWAISRGDPSKPAATPEEAEEMHALIRSLLPKERCQATRLLYGGSMKGENAMELLTQPNIDGGLVGGASLKPEEFRQIVEAAARARKG